MLFNGFFQTTSAKQYSTLEMYMVCNTVATANTTVTAAVGIGATTTVITA